MLPLIYMGYLSPPINFINLDNNFKFINNNNGIIIAADDNGSVSIYNDGKIEKIKVAKTVWKAANSNSHKLRYPVGADGKGVLFLKRILPNSWFFAVVRKVVEKGFKK